VAALAKLCRVGGFDPGRIFPFQGRDLQKTLILLGFVTLALPVLRSD